MVSTLTVITPTIDPEFQNLCQPHTPEELANLRRLIVEAGKCDDILVWNADDYPILDGHTRHLICTNEGIPFGVKLVDLPDREAAIDFIARIQLGRRNASEEQKSYLRGKLFNQIKTTHGGDRKSKGQSDPLISPSTSTTYENETSTEMGGIGNTRRENTAEKVAAETGVSPKTVKRDGVFATAVDALAAKSSILAEAARIGQLPKSSVPKLATAPQATLTEIERLPGPQRRKAAQKAVGGPRNNGKPRPRERAATPADEAKAQVKIWADTIGRWLGKSPSIDDLRGQFPGKPGDTVVGHATALFEALKNWEKAIR